MATTTDPAELDLTSLDGTGLGETELVDILRALEDLKAQAAAAQARLTRALDLTVRERHTREEVPAARRGRDVAALVAFARRESPARGSRHLGFARALTELPATEAAMDAGDLSEWRGTLIARETAVLDAEHRALVDEWIAGTCPDGTHRFDGWGDQRLIAETRRAVADLDPAAVVQRRSRAEADRRVTSRPAPDAMAQVTALLPAAQGVAVWATLSRAADAARAAGDKRSRGQVMADTLVERVTGQATADAVGVTVSLVVSDETLLAGGREPAWLQGYGPLTADHAIDLTRTAIEDAEAALRRLYARPATGALVAMESTAREFPAALAQFLRLRDRTCRTAYCNAAIRHHDHVVGHADGGPTTAENGQGVCEQCNYAKQAPGWRMRPITGPPATAEAPHAVETTLPTGHVTTTVAPLAPTPSLLVPADGARIRGEIYRTDLVLELDYAA